MEGNGLTCVFLGDQQPKGNQEVLKHVLAAIPTTADDLKFDFPLFREVRHTLYALAASPLPKHTHARFPKRTNAHANRQTL